MATITTVSVGGSGWTQLDSGSPTYLDAENEGDDAIGIRINATDPGAGVAWNASGSKKLPGGQSWPMGLTAGDHVWARRENATAANVAVLNRA